MRRADHSLLLLPHRSTIYIAIMQGDMSHTDHACMHQFVNRILLQEARQYLTLVEDSQEEEHCEELDQLFSCLDGSSSSSSSGSARKRKKKGGEVKEAWVDLHLQHPTTSTHTCATRDT